MLEMVIFKELGRYKMTNLENYERRIRNANEVTTFYGCNSFEQCIQSLGRVENVMFYDRTGDV